MVFNTESCTFLPDNSILITANMQSETGFPSSHQLKSYVAFKSPLKLAARAVLSADAGLLVVHGQVTIIFVVSDVGLSVCCAEFFSAVFDPISIKLGHILYVWV